MLQAMLCTCTLVKRNERTNWLYMGTWARRERHGPGWSKAHCVIIGASATSER